MKVLMNNDDWKKYPDCPKEVPDSLLSAKHAMANHGQTLHRLNERGGMSPAEIISNIYEHKWANYAKMSTRFAVDELIIYLRNHQVKETKI